MLAHVCVQECDHEGDPRVGQLIYYLSCGSDPLGELSWLLFYDL